MPDAPATRRRRFRFGLRTLLVALSVAALASWLYWDGWPWYKVHREESQFLRTVKQLKPGTTVMEADDALPRERREARLAHRRTWGYAVYQLPTTLYFLYVPVADTPHAARTSLELFRLAPFPPNYVAKTQWGREQVAWVRSIGEDPDRWPKAAYWSDFYEMIRSDRRDNLGFEYELIYAAPPKIK